MDSGAILSEAVTYTQETFMGKWTRWLIFIILGLPTALFPFVFDMTKIMDNKTAQIHWELVAWDQVAIVVAAAFLFSFFLAGYAVRIYRGAKPAPDFDNWGSMFIDGLKLCIVEFLWFLPLLIVLLVVVGLAIVGMASGGGTGSMGLLLGLILLAILIEIIVCIVIVLFSSMGAIRFVRTGSITEGLHYSKISEHIGRIGWGQYIIALVILFVTMILFGIIGMILALIPYIGWVCQLVITPLFMVFAARYYTLVYEQGQEQAATPLFFSFFPRVTPAGFITLPSQTLITEVTFMDEIKRAFDATASRYDAQRKWIIPEMDDYYSAAVWAAECKNPAPAILDIGAGTGLLSALMIQKFPDASLTLIDLSESMLNIARERFADRPDVRYITGDYSSVDFAGHYDLCCSALSIHHLEHDDKRRLYRKIFAALNPGGMFVNADQVLGEKPAINRRYMAYWDDFLVPCPLSPEDKKQMLYRRDTFDRNEKLSIQLGWMADCGFEEIDLVYKNRLFVVFTGRKEEELPESMPGISLKR